MTDQDRRPSDFAYLYITTRAFSKRVGQYEGWTEIAFERDDYVDCQILSRPLQSLNETTDQVLMDAYAKGWDNRHWNYPEIDAEYVHAYPAEKAAQPEPEPEPEPESHDARDPHILKGSQLMGRNYEDVFYAFMSGDEELSRLGARIRLIGKQVNHGLCAKKAQEYLSILKDLPTMEQMQGRLRADQRRPRLMIIGHSGHGKDEVCRLLTQNYGFSCRGSSMEALERVIWPAQSHLYEDSEACFADRHSHQALWFHLIEQYHEDDNTRLAKNIYHAYDVYNGCRSRREFDAIKDAQLFDVCIWVEATVRTGTRESEESMRLDPLDADFELDNNGTLDETALALDKMLVQIIRDFYDPESGQ